MREVGGSRGLRGTSYYVQSKLHSFIGRDAAEEEPQTTRPSTDKEQHTRILTNHGEQLPL